MLGGIGDFLTQAVEWVYEWWPIRIVSDWEQGVRMRAGNATALLTASNGLWGTGVHFFWPRLGEIIIQDTNLEVLETDLQSVEDAEGVVWTFSLGVMFKVRDLKALVLKVHDHQQSIVETLRSTGGRACAYLATEDVAEHLGEETLRRVRRATHGWGLEVRAVRPINMCRAQALRLIQDASG